MPRTIAAVTSSRADFGHLHWPLHELARREGVDVRLITLGAHLAPEFGETVLAIEAAGFEVDERIECLLSSDSDVGMAKTIGIATQSLADTLGRMRPDLLLVIADRYEMIAPASVALALRIPVAHIEGGEVSAGAIDNQVRHALTKMSHVHFTPTQLARERVVSMGEDEWRVHRVGAPSLDHLRRSALVEPNEVAARLGFSEGEPIVVVGYHPVTIARDTTLEADAVFAALEALDDRVVFCFPNADAGSRALIRRAEAFCDGRERADLHVNLDHVLYWSLLRCASAMLGNSSSGIMESPSLALPAVNIGARQDGRERAPNVIDVEPNTDAILASMRRALSNDFRATLNGMENPYGDGHAGERIADVLASVEIDERLLRKEQ